MTFGLALGTKRAARKVTKAPCSLRQSPHSTRHWKCMQENLPPQTGRWSRTTWALRSGTRRAGCRAGGHRFCCAVRLCVSFCAGVRRRKAYLHDWATTQNNLGIVLSDQAEAESKGQRAPSASTGCLDVPGGTGVYTKKAAGLGDDPEQSGFCALGPSEPDPRARGHTSASTGCLDVSGLRWRSIRKKDLPQDWAMTQNNLGVALRDQLEAGCRWTAPHEKRC